VDVPLNHIFYPSSFSDLFTVWNRFPSALLYAGGTDINLKSQNKDPVLICMDKIDDLHTLTRTEQYLDIGAMVKLNSLLRLGKIVPHVLCKCLENIAGLQVRNIATVGGNICGTDGDLPLPLNALDAQYELRTAQSSRWVSSARFHSSSEDTDIKNQELLTRIRLPLRQWDYSVYKKFSGTNFFSDESFVFLANTSKNILSEIRILYKGRTIVRNKEGEAILNGKYLPFHRKTADEFVHNWKEFLKNKPEESDFFKNALLNSIEENVYNLTD